MRVRVVGFDDTGLPLHLRFPSDFGFSVVVVPLDRPHLSRDEMVRGLDMEGFGVTRKTSTVTLIQSRHENTYLR